MQWEKSIKQEWNGSAIQREVGNPQEHGKKENERAHGDLGTKVDSCIPKSNTQKERKRVFNTVGMREDKNNKSTAMSMVWCNYKKNGTQPDRRSSLSIFVTEKERVHGHLGNPMARSVPKVNLPKKVVFMTHGMKMDNSRSIVVLYMENRTVLW